MPSSTASTFADPAEYQARVRAADVKVLVTTRGQFKAELIRMDLHRLWMQRGLESLPRITHAQMSSIRDPLFFLSDARQPGMHHTGMEVSTDHVVAYGTAAHHHHRTSAECRWASLSLSPEALSEAGRVLIGRDLKRSAVTRLIRPPPAALARLRTLHEAAGHLARTAPDIFAHPEVAKAMEQALVRAMVSCLADREETGPTGREHQRVRVMRLFERVLEEEQDWPLYLEDVCAKIGVSDRTLRAHCQEHLGMSPYKYLWLRRMHMVQRALAQANPKSATVTGVANDHGFGELGRFAGSYRTLFGEAPAATLRRPFDKRTSARMRTA